MSTMGTVVKETVPMVMNETSTMEVASLTKMMTLMWKTVRVTVILWIIVGVHHRKNEGCNDDKQRFNSGNFNSDYVDEGNSDHGSGDIKNDDESDVDSRYSFIDNESEGIVNFQDINNADGDDLDNG